MSPTRRSILAALGLAPIAAALPKAEPVKPVCTCLIEEHSPSVDGGYSDHLAAGIDETEWVTFTPDPDCPVHRRA